jgi:hypothetical protein
MSDNIRGLIRSSGLALSDDEEARLIALYERFAGDRARLAGAPIGEREPATIFQAPNVEDERERQR